MGTTFNNPTQNVLPSYERYIESLNQFHTECVIYDEKFPRNDPFYKDTMESKETWEDVPMEYKFKQQNLFYFIEDVYAQDLFTFFVDDLLRMNLFDESRKKVRTYQNLRPNWKGAAQVLQLIDFTQEKFLAFVQNVIENRTYLEIQSGQATKINDLGTWKKVFENLIMMK